MVQVLKVENLLLNHNHVSLRKEFQGFWFLQLKNPGKNTTAYGVNHNDGKKHYGYRT